jgi:hypothetical protein
MAAYLRPSRFIWTQTPSASIWMTVPAIGRFWPAVFATVIECKAEIAHVSDRQHVRPTAIPDLEGPLTDADTLGSEHVARLRVVRVAFRNPDHLGAAAPPGSGR